MGVPVVSLAGEAHRSRVGASLLGVLCDNVAATHESFVVKAVSASQIRQAAALPDGVSQAPEGFALCFSDAVTNGGAG